MLLVPKEPRRVLFQMDGRRMGAEGLSTGEVAGVVVGILVLIAITGFALTRLPVPKHKLPPVKSKAVETTLDSGDNFSKVWS